MVLVKRCHGKIHNISIFVIIPTGLTGQTFAGQIGRWYSLDAQYSLFFQYLLIHDSALYEHVGTY